MQRRIEYQLALLIVTTPFLTGCRHRNVPATPIILPAQPAAAPRASDSELRKAKVNEGGVVLILEYHDVEERENDARFARSITNFRADLERLYSEGYRPVTLHDYLDNRISTPIGTSPVVFTFDDARGSQFRYLSNGEIDPNCAVGIMQAFQKSHPDFVIKPTFYILPRRKFSQPPLATKKLQALLAMGCEIGNHTVTHRPMARLTDAEVQQELGSAVQMAKELDPDIEMDTLALPEGSTPHNRKLLASGSYNGTTYHNRAVLKAGAGPAPSPASGSFNPMALPRIQVVGSKFGSTFWLDTLKKHPDRRYISDGDPLTVVVPKKLAYTISKGRLHGAALRTY